MKSLIFEVYCILADSLARRHIKHPAQFLFYNILRLYQLEGDHGTVIERSINELKNKLVFISHKRCIFSKQFPLNLTVDSFFYQKSTYSICSPDDWSLWTFLFDSTFASVKSVEEDEARKRCKRWLFYLNFAFQKLETFVFQLKFRSIRIDNFPLLCSS